MTTEEIKKLEATLWQTADTLRANSDLKSSEYSTPVLGLIFLKFADNKYSRFEKEINEIYDKNKGKRLERPIEEIAIEKCGFYLPPESRYEYLLNLPEKEDIAKALKKAMQLIEQYKPELKATLPQDEYFQLVRKPEFRDIPKRLLKNFADIPKNVSGDMFGQIYEYFLGKFAMAEGQGGGEFFTPRSVVRLMVEIIEPHNGTVFDPACGSGGMFVQSAQFIEKRKSEEEDSSLFVYGQEKTLETVKLAKMNIAVNGLRGDIRQANTYYEDLHDSFGRFDYVLANPPFNVDDVSLAKVERDKRFNTQIDRAHREFTEEQILNIAVISRLHRNNRQAFIDLVHSYYDNGFISLTENRPQLAEVAGKVIGFLKENKADHVPDFQPVLKDADKLLKAYADYQKSVELTSIDKANKSQRKLSETVAPFFIKLHELLKEVDKAVRHIEKDQSRNKDLKTLKTELELLHKEAKATEYYFSHIAWLQERFPEAKYDDVTGLCKLANIDEVKEQEYSLNPGRYVGVVIEEDGKTEEEFIEEMLSLNAELEQLNKEARELENVIGKNIRLIAGEE